MDINDFAKILSVISITISVGGMVTAFYIQHQKKQHKE